ncbi:2'-5'-oligoadenylate synthase 3-like [Apostichopus japonicus]|uniref:2'-5'-oligoadenylate synthase 3-like n=1 Tax=Stichopus japonicus TaxID=307972 RepID=UPI003AB47FE4
MDLQTRLRNFAQELAPSESSGKEVERCTNQIRQGLEDYCNGKSTFNRLEVVGSIGKKTSLWISMDIDIVVYFDDVVPPFDNIIETLKCFVKSNYDPNCQVTKHAVMFKYGEFFVDLLPATNFVPNYNNYRGRTQIQVNNVLKCLKSNSNLRHKEFSSSLSGAAVGFLKEQDSFTHSLCRLAKYWAMTVPLKGFCPGRSTIMELLAVKAAEETKIEQRQNIIQGFRTFLFKVRKINELEIFWEHCYTQDWIPLEILDEPPYLMDPTNPFNNLLSPRAVQYLEQLKRFANNTLCRLEKAECNWDQVDQSLAVKKIFFPLSRFQKLVDEGEKYPDFFVLGFKEMELHMPSIKIHSQTAEQTKVKTKVKPFFRMLTSFMCAISDQVKEAISCRNVQSVKSVMLSNMEDFIGGDWFDSADEHDERDVSIYIPISRSYTADVIVVSFDWCLQQASETIGECASDDETDSAEGVFTYDDEECCITKAYKYIIRKLCGMDIETQPESSPLIVSCPIMRNRANKKKNKHHNEVNEL